MPKLKMKKTAKGAPDGAIVQEYLAGEEYDVPQSLFDAFVVQMGVAEKAVPRRRRGGTKKKMGPPPNPTPRNTASKAASTSAKPRKPRKRKKK